MYQFKAFLSLPSLADNAANVVAPIGELSEYAMTFAKDIKKHPSTLQNLALYGFSSKSSLTGKLTVPNAILSKALVIAEWLYQRQSTLSSSETNNGFRTAFIEAFTSTCSNLDCGGLVVGQDGKQYPEYVTWKDDEYANEDNQNTLWLSDAEFRRSYDEYEIVVIPPVTDLNVFFGAYTTAVELANARTYTEAMAVIQEARQNYPETILTAETYHYVNPNNSTVKNPTNWSFLVYGPHGNDSDILRQTLIEYLLLNTARSEADWKKVFPDIFKSTEFLIFPRWHNYAIEERVLQAGIYSPNVQAKKELDYLKSVLPNLPSAHIDNYLSFMAYPYKSLCLSILGGLENRDNLFELRQLFPDILNVSSTSLDFNRMSASTKEFLLKLATMIYTAEHMDQYTAMPMGYRRVEREAISYISMTYQHIRYLVASKQTTPDYPA